MSGIIVTGSIATDHLMHFPGRFADQIMTGMVDRLSLSFLVDGLVVHRGGAAANMAYGMGLLGLRPSLIGAVGRDFGDYRAWLEGHGVSCDRVHVSTTAETSRFLCTTDDAQCQIAVFYPGAMAEAAAIDLAAVAPGDPPDLVVIGPDDPDAMLRHAAACRDRRWRFAADPSQQLARLPGSAILDFITGAEYLLVNEYEQELLRSKVDLPPESIRALVGTEIVTLGERGVRITGPDGETLDVPAITGVLAVDPTGAGDAFRAGLFAGIAWQLPLRLAAQVGCVLAAQAIAVHGTQEYAVDAVELDASLSRVYGAQDAAVISDARRRHGYSPGPLVTGTPPAGGG
jgi:adenosine kinase